MQDDATPKKKFASPLTTKAQIVPAEWIDYNGHMNVSYYSMAFDQAVDDIFENILGIGKSHTKATQHGPYVLQNNLHYLAEFLQGEEFTVQIQLIDHDQKRLHLFLQMINQAGVVGATCEQMVMNVDLSTRRSTLYPDWVLQQLAELQALHNHLPKPSQLGAAIGIRRKG